MSAVTARRRVIVALDVSSLAEARAVVRRLGDAIRFYKIGKQLFTGAGPAAVRMVRDAGADVFLDLKFHDIPNTVGQAVAQAARLGVRLVNVHASGGPAMMAEAVAAVGSVCRRERLVRPKVLAVTVLTSLGRSDLRAVGVRAAPTAQVVRLARLARDAGLDGVVASPLEIEAVRSACGDDFLTVTPGVRMPGAATHDQRRVRAPADAIAAGADWIVVGRPILAAPDPVAAAGAIAADVARGLAWRRGPRP